MFVQNMKYVSTGRFERKLVRYGCIGLPTFSATEESFPLRVTRRL